KRQCCYPDGSLPLSSETQVAAFFSGLGCGCGCGCGCFQLLTSPAVERAEHRSGVRGAEAHMSERSELCAVPSPREERRGLMRRSRIGSRPAVFLLVTFSLHGQREVTRCPKGSESLCS